MFEILICVFGLERFDNIERLEYFGIGDVLVRLCVEVLFFFGKGRDREEGVVWEGWILRI